MTRPRQTHGIRIQTNTRLVCIWGSRQGLIRTRCSKAAMVLKKADGDSPLPKQLESLVVYFINTSRQTVCSCVVLTNAVSPRLR